MAALTLATIYGLAFMVYGWDYLSFTGVPALAKFPPSSGNGEIYFVVPIFTFTILVGLLMDYRIFLISRGVE